MPHTRWTTDLCWTQIYVGHRSMLDTDLSWTQIYVDTDLCWTQIYFGHRSKLDSDPSWTTDLSWTTGPSWVTFLTIFGLFPGGPRSVPRAFLLMERYSREVLGVF